jgi:hypothetical protein
VPFATGNQNDSIIALKDGKMINFVVPCPMGAQGSPIPIMTIGIVVVACLAAFVAGVP